MTEKNFPMLWKIYEHIKMHPLEWRQYSWVTTRDVQGPNDVYPVMQEYRLAGETRTCGTAFCFAGHAAFAAGWSPVWDFDDREFSNVYMRKDGHRQRKIWSIAQEELGLTQRECDLLFEGDNTLDEIHNLIAYWEEQARA